MAARDRLRQSGIDTLTADGVAQQDAADLMDLAAARGRALRIRRTTATALTAPGEPLTVEAAGAIYDLLVEFAGADPDHDTRAGFVHSQTTRFCREFRFVGALGLGGKFRRTTSHRPGAGVGETWLVSAYREDITPARAAVIERTNLVLDATRTVHLAEEARP